MYEDYKEDAYGYVSLLRRKTLLSQKTVGRVDLDPIELNSGGNLLIDNFGYPTKGRQIGMRLEFNLHADKSKFKSNIDVMVNNANGFKFWESFRLDKLFKNMDNRQIVLNILVPSHNEEELNVSLNFVNIDGVKCSIDKARCYFYELE